MSTNQQVVFSKHGSPEQVLALKEASLPDKVPADHYRIAVKASPVNPADRIFIEGHYNSLTATAISKGQEAVAGSELAGVIVAVGENSLGDAALAVGTRVYASCNFPDTGAWAQFIDVSVKGLVVPLPEGVSYASGCQLLVNPVTVAGFLHELEELKVGADDYYVLTAGGSAVGRLCLQLAKLRGTPGRAICVVRNPAHKQKLLELGAHAVIATAEQPQVGPALEQVLGADGKLRVIFDALGGGPVTSALVDRLAVGGVCFVYGLMVEEPMAYDVAHLLFAGAAVKGWWLGHFLGQHGAKLPTILKEILDHLASGKLTLEHKEFDLVKEWQQALFHCKTGSKGGKTVITNP